MSFEEIEAEGDVLAGVLRHGHDAYLDACVWVPSVDFLNDDYGQDVWACVKKHYDSGETRLIDQPTLMGLARELRLDRQFDKTDMQQYVRMLYNKPVALSTVEPQAQRVFKAHTKRDLSEMARSVDKELHQLTGDETLAAVFAVYENPFNHYMSTLGHAKVQAVTKLGEGSREWYLEKMKNPGFFRGIPSPYPKYNSCIGGGYRCSTVTLEGARLKTGKTLKLMNEGLWVAREQGIPVLFVDTEMTQEEHRYRALANISGVEIHKIELSTTDEEETKLVLQACDILDSIPYFHKDVQTNTFEEQCAMIRRWLSKIVVNYDKMAPPEAFVIYDYLKMASQSDFKRDLTTTEAMGINMLALLNIAGKFDIPMKSAMQLNRDGVEIRDSRAFAGSDMPARSASSASLFYRKTPEEIADDGGWANGTHEIVVTDARHGPGTQGDSIQMIMDGNRCRIIEGEWTSELRRGRGSKPSNKQTFEKKPRKKKTESNAPNLTF